MKCILERKPFLRRSMAVLVVLLALVYIYTKLYMPQKLNDLYEENHNFKERILTDAFKPKLSVSRRFALADLKQMMLEAEKPFCLNSRDGFQVDPVSSLAPRMSNSCSPNSIQLVFSKNALSQCVNEQRYCFSFLETTTKLPGETTDQIILATPGFALLPAAQNTLRGMVFPFLPVNHAFLKNNATQFTNTIENPYRRHWLLGSLLGIVNGKSGASYRFLKHPILRNKDEVVNMSFEVDAAKCFGPSINMNLNGVWLPCSKAKKVLENSDFCFIIFDDWGAGSPSLNTIRSIQAQLWACLSAHSIPYIPFGYKKERAQIYLPFFKILEKLWITAILFVDENIVNDSVNYLNRITQSQKQQLLDSGALLLKRHLGTLHAQVETAVATLTHSLEILSPPRPYIRTKPVTRQKEANSISYHEFDKILPNSYQFSKKQSSYLDAMHAGPLWSYRCTPWMNCSSSGLDNTKVTVICMTYKRQEPLRQNMLRIASSKLIHSMIIIWNDIVKSPVKMKWPKTLFPLKIVSAPANKLTNRYLPLDLIETEGVLILDDDVGLNEASVERGFKIWSSHRDSLAGYLNAAHYWLLHKKKIRYNWDNEVPYSLLPTGAAFMHQYYLFAFTYELEKEALDKVERTFDCDDVSMNFLLHQISRQQPYVIESNTVFRTPPGYTGLSRRAESATARNYCIQDLIQIFGYDPLKWGTTFPSSIN